MELEKFARIFIDECPTIMDRLNFMSKLSKTTAEVLEAERIVQEIENLSKRFELKEDELKEDDFK